uniref:Uncharacterized protein n=1 Tax=Anguilla anguilla TaxID=7936 RepID=A0A0E9Q2I7_ANGAN
MDFILFSVRVKMNSAKY